jgi:hypothetical protein
MLAPLIYNNIMLELNDIEQAIIFLKLKGFRRCRMTTDKDILIIYAEDKNRLVSIRFGSQIQYLETPKRHKE